MNMQMDTVSLRVRVFALLIALIAPLGAMAHCDSLDGPVVKAAQAALRTRNVNLILIWVQSKDEPELKTAFRKTLAVRKLSGEARDLADRYFFETVVRIHRAGEGEPYTGLKPAGRDLGPAIPAADRAIDSGSTESLLRLFPAAEHAGIIDRFGRVMAIKGYNPNNVSAGREYVKAYVEFIHYIEELYDHPRADAQRPNQSRQKHIAIEGDEIFALAGKIMTRAGLVSVGEEMAKRSGVDLEAFDARLDGLSSKVER